MTLDRQLVFLFVLAIPIASIAWTVTHDDLFREPRDWCVARSKSCERLLARKVFYLFTCEYCFSHWVTIVILFITRYKLLYDARRLQNPRNGRGPWRGRGRIHGMDPLTSDAVTRWFISAGVLVCHGSRCDAARRSASGECVIWNTPAIGCAISSWYVVEARSRGQQRVRNVDWRICPCRLLL